MLATWLINHLMCGISVGLPKGQFFYVITLDQQVIHRRTRIITKLNETYLRKLKFDGSSIKSFVVHRVNMRCARTAVTQSLKAFWANKHISKNNGREQR